ncbi:MAG: AMP-binding protein [Pseudomonadales bacterium]
MTFAKHYAADDPHAIAIRDEFKAFTWADVDDQLNRCANGLQAMDLGPDKRIAVFAGNSIYTALANLGGLIAGASVVPVNFHLTAEEVAYILEDSDTRVLFVGPDTVETGLQAAASVANVHTVIGWRCANPKGLINWEIWINEQNGGEPDHSVTPKPNLLYTSGTTGRPKGTDTPPTMFVGGADINEHFALYNQGIAERHGGNIGPQLVVGPMYHAGPLGATKQLIAGFPSVILGRFDAEKTLAAIEEHKIAFTLMVPTHFVRLLALTDDIKAKYDVSSIESVSHTGAQCPVDVKRRMIEWFGPVFLDAYGASEVGATCMITSEEWLQHPGSVGKAIPPFTTRILDDDDNEVPPNTEGRLFFEDATGRGVIYHNDPEKSAAAHIAPGVFTLGEIAYMNEEGYVFITDRFSDMVVSGGVNIYPAEAEQVLIEHPAVLDVACIGVPNKEMGEELKALVIAHKDMELPSPDALIAWCRERLSHYKCPKTLDYVDDIGRNTMGKVNKRKLRAPYWD